MAAAGGGRNGGGWAWRAGSRGGPACDAFQHTEEGDRGQSSGFSTKKHDQAAAPTSLSRSSLTSGPRASFRKYTVLRLSLPGGLVVCSRMGQGRGGGVRQACGRQVGNPEWHERPTAWAGSGGCGGGDAPPPGLCRRRRTAGGWHPLAPETLAARICGGHQGRRGWGRWAGLSKARPAGRGRRSSNSAPAPVLRGKEALP